ncbi:MAG: hypothetical protein AAFN10_22895 [Bacteroidota bacterium]
MIRTFSTFCLLLLYLSPAAQNLKALYQNGTQSWFDAASCTNASTCDDGDSLNIDYCFNGHCAHATTTGMSYGYYNGLTLESNGKLWFTTPLNMGSYEDSHTKILNRLNTNWDALARLSNQDPIIDANGDTWVVSSQRFNNNYQIGRWDGLDWDSYSNQAGDLAGTLVRSIAKGANSSIWALHYYVDQISHFDGNSWQSIDLSQVAALAGFNPCQIAFDSAGDLWIAGYSGSSPTYVAMLAQYDGTNWILHNSGLPMHWTPRDMLIDQNDEKWFYSNDSELFRYNGSWSSYSDSAGSLPPGQIRDISEGENQQIWLAMGLGGLVKFDPSTNTSITYTSQNSNSQLTYVYKVAANPDTNLVYTAGSYTKRLQRFDGTNWSIHNDGSGPLQPTYRSFVKVLNDGQIMNWGYPSQDHAFFDGNTWQNIPNQDFSINDVVAVQNGGFYLAVSQNDGYIKYFDGDSLSTLDSLPFANPTLPNSPFVRNLVMDSQQRLWASSIAAIWRYDGQSWTEFGPNTGAFPLNSGESVYRLFQDYKGDFWVWISNGDLYRYDGNQWQLELNHSPFGASNIVPSPTGSIWFSSTDSLFEYDNGLIQSFDINNTPWGSIQWGRIAIDPNGMPWGLDTVGNLIQFDGSNFPSLNTAALGLEIDTVSFHTFDAEGNLWLTSWDGIAEIEVFSDIEGVWPGDANDDLIANNFDLLALGQAFGSGGPARPNASLNWQAQSVSSWASNLPSGVNYAHTDTDGSGVVNQDDTLAINLNYGLTHNKTSGFAQFGAPPLLIIPEQNSYQSGDTAYASIELGLDTLIADSVYGIAFTINYDPSLVEMGSVQIDYANSWLGIKNQNMLTLAKDDHANGRVDLALVRNDQINQSGFGQIAKIRVVMIDDISGKICYEIR